jgi:hypothetical protein
VSSDDDGFELGAAIAALEAAPSSENAANAAAAQDSSRLSASGCSR